MKKIISFLLACSVIASALSLCACGKKHTIDTDVAMGGNESVSGGAGVVYENVTDEKGENVTDAEGEAVTVAVPAEEASSGEAASAKKGETPANATEAATQKGENATKKSETTTKKSEAATQKSESATKKAEQPTQKQSSQQASTTQPPKAAVNGSDCRFELRTDKTEVSAGDTFTVTLKLKNCKNVACFGIYVKCGARKGVVETDKFKSNRFTDEDGNNFDIYSNSDDKSDPALTSEEKGVLFGGMTSTAYSFMDDDLCTVTYKVTSDAKKGDTLVVSAVPNQFLICPDESGASTQDVKGDIEIVPITVTVR